MSSFRISCVQKTFRKKGETVEALRSKNILAFKLLIRCRGAVAGLLSDLFVFQFGLLGFFYRGGTWSVNARCACVRLLSPLWQWSPLNQCSSRGALPSLKKAWWHCLSHFSSSPVIRRHNLPAPSPHPSPCPMARSPVPLMAMATALVGHNMAWRLGLPPSRTRGLPPYVIFWFHLSGTNPLRVPQAHHQPLLSLLSTLLGRLVLRHLRRPDHGTTWAQRDWEDDADEHPLWAVSTDRWWGFPLPGALATLLLKTIIPSYYLKMHQFFLCIISERVRLNFVPLFNYPGQPAFWLPVKKEEKKKKSWLFWAFFRVCVCLWAPSLWNWWNAWSAANSRRVPSVWYPLWHINCGGESLPVCRN